MNRKAIVLLSGGLDSILAVKIMLEEGIEVEAVNYFIEFAACVGEDSAAKAARTLGIPLKRFDITGEYLGIFKAPKHGYGANINPCIDCKIFMLRKAKEYMSQSAASFLVTGEVLGERPMSQRKDALSIIEKEAGVKGILLRPLSAKLLNETIPEKEGVVDRNKLYGISGRSRKPQMELASRFGIREYPNPAGGCLLTDPGFTKRIRDLLAHGSLALEEMRLLKFGRHFRLSEEAKLIVGRDADDNMALEKLATADDISFKLKHRQGPYSILRGSHDEGLVRSACAIIAYHTKFRNEEALEIDYWLGNSSARTTLTAKPANIEEVERIRI